MGQVVAVVALAVVALGVSAPLVRTMDAGPAAIATWRTIAAAVLLTPAVVRAPRPSRVEAANLAAAGLCLAAHFVLWFASLGLTTVLRSTVLVCLTPIWAGLLEAGVDHEAPPRRFWVGAGVAAVGSGLLAGGGWAGGDLRGDALALVAGLLWPLYLRLTRGYRLRAGSFAAMGYVCLAAAAVCAVTALAIGEPLAGWGSRTWVLLAAAVALPQLVGHQGLAWAVAWVPASRLSAATLLEPVVATAIAAVAFHERPGALALAGAAIVLGGVGICIGGGAGPVVEGSRRR